MSAQAKDILRAVRAALEGDVYQKAFRLLPDEGTIVDVWNPSRGSVNQLLPSLKARLQNAERSGKLIYGIASTITHLEQMRLEENVVGYSVTAPHVDGMIYLLEHNMGGVGVVLVDR